MPIKNCRHNEQPGFKWGDAGKCFTYIAGNDKSKSQARAKAVEQGQAIEISRRSDQKFVTQSIIVKKSNKIKTVKQAEKIAKEHGNITTSRETENSFRFRQISPEKIIQKGCKTLVINDDISLVRCPKK